MAREASPGPESLSTRRNEIPALVSHRAKASPVGPAPTMRTSGRLTATVPGEGRRPGVRGRVWAPGLADVPGHRPSLRQPAGPGRARLGAAVSLRVRPRSPSGGGRPEEPPG